MSKRSASDFQESSDSKKPKCLDNVEEIEEEIIAQSKNSEQLRKNLSEKESEAAFLRKMAAEIKQRAEQADSGIVELKEAVAASDKQILKLKSTKNRMLNPRSDCVRFNGLGKSDTVRRLIFHADHFQAQFNSDRQAVVKYSHMVEFLTCATASKELVIEQTYKDTHDQMNCFTGLYQILKGFGRNVEYLELTGQFNQKQVTDWLDPLVSLHELVFLDFRFDVIGNLSMIFRYISPSVKVLYFDARLTNKPDFLDTMHAFYDMNIKLKRDTLFKKLFFCVHNFPTRSRFTEALDIINTRMDPNGTVTVLTNQMVDDEICCLLEQHGLYLKWTGYFRESLNHSTKIKYALFAGRWQQIKWEIALACPKASR